MSKYFKIFQNKSEYESFVASDNFVTPNVSLVQNENLVFYNPKTKIISDIVATFNATSSNLYALRKTSGVEKLYVNDEEITDFGTSYSFAEPGEYTVSVILDENKTIPKSSFSGTTLTSVEIGSGVTSIGNYAFTSCSGLTGITIPDSVTSIGDGAFQNCSGLTGTLIIPDSVTSIGNSVFYNCSGLTSVTIGSGVTSIGRYAFSSCSGLTSVTIGSGVTSIGEWAFRYCKGLTGELVIPDSVTSIGTQAFNGCSGLTELTIGSGVTSIGSYAFEDCYGLTSITIPGSVTTIGNRAFSSCSGLTSVTIGSGITTIGNYVFGYCYELTSIYYNSTKSDWNTIYKEPWWKDNSNIERIICTDGVIEMQDTTDVGMIYVHESNIHLAVNESRFIGFNIMDTTLKGYITNAVENAKDGNYYYYLYDTSSLSVRTAHENMKGNGYYEIEVTGLQPGVHTLTIYAGPGMKSDAVTQDITVTVTE